MPEGGAVMLTTKYKARMLCDKLCKISKAAKNYITPEVLLEKATPAEIDFFYGKICVSR